MREITDWYQPRRRVVVPGLPAEMKLDSDSDLMTSRTARLFCHHNYPGLLVRCSSYILFQSSFRRAGRKKWGEQNRGVSFEERSHQRDLWVSSWLVIHRVWDLIYTEPKGQREAEKNTPSWEYSKLTLTPRVCKWFESWNNKAWGSKDMRWHGINLYNWRLLSRCAVMGK